MWTSVPQIDATFTRIRTSVGPTDGIGTVRISVLFGAVFDFTAAFIVDVIPKSPGQVRSWTLGISTFYHSPGSATNPISSGRSTESPLNRMQLRRAVANDHEKVLARPKLLVEGGISGVDAKDRRRGELAWCRDHDHVLRSDSPEDGRTHLEVPASEDETLPAHRAHHEPCLRGSVEEAEDLGLVQVLRDRLPSDHGVDSEQGLLDPERGCESLDGGAGSQQEQRVRIRLEQFGEVRRQFRADGLLAQLLDHELPGGDELRLNQRFRGGEESDSPFSFPIRFFVQVENFRDTDS